MSLGQAAGHSNNHLITQTGTINNTYSRTQTREGRQLGYLTSAFNHTCTHPCPLNPLLHALFYVHLTYHTVRIQNTCIVVLTQLTHKMNTCLV